MSITFDTERWSSPSRAWDIEQAIKRKNSPRLVSIGESPYFQAKADIQGDAMFRQFTQESNSTLRIIRRSEKGESNSDE